MKVFPPPRAAAVYHPGLRLLHWLMAALIFVALPLGVWASLVPRGSERSEILFFHKSIGMTVLCLVALRIVWRLVSGAPAYAEPLGRLTHAAARSAHIGLYALMIAMPVSGYLSSNGAGTVVPWFGLFTFPHLLPKNDALRIGGRAGALCVRLDDRLCARRASRRGRLARRDQARLGLDANVAAISAGPVDRQILTAGFRIRSRHGPP